MSKINEVLKNETLLEKVAVAETKDDAMKACKDAGVEMNDAELDDVAGGLSTAAKVLIGVGAAAATAGAGYAGFKWYKKRHAVTAAGPEPVAFGPDPEYVAANKANQAVNRTRVNGQLTDATDRNGHR